MRKKGEIVVWRWANPSKKFEPVQNWMIKQEAKLRTHRYVVYAGLNPSDWFLFKGKNEQVLHKIILTKEQAQKCVVAEGQFRPTREEMNHYIKKRKIRIVGSMRTFEREKYPENFIPLLEYQGEFNLPEVLIPFSVEAKICRIQTFTIKALKWFTQLKNRLTFLLRNSSRKRKNWLRSME